MCFLGLFRGMVEEWWVFEMTCTCFRGFCWEVQMRKIGVTIEKKIYEFSGTLHV